MNISEVMRFGAKILTAAGVENARFDADHLLGFVLDSPRDRLYLDRERELNNGELDRYQDLVKRRAAREPLQYILRRQEFMGLDLYVDPRVLIPRPDSEILVEKLLELVGGSPYQGTPHPDISGPELHFAQATPLEDEDGPTKPFEARNTTGTRTSSLKSRTSISVLDLCTGSGALAVAVAHFLPGAYVVGTDISHDALMVARRNGEMTGVPVEWRQGDFLNPAQGRKWDWIITNPPYVSLPDYEKCAPEVHHEPRKALVGGTDGLDFYRRLAGGVGSLLSGRGGVLMEIGWDQAGPVQTLFAEQGFTTTVFLDSGGRDRVILAI